jgi:hypothetical protein
MTQTILQFKEHKWYILSGTAIKIIGIVLMFLDHLYQMFQPQGAPQWLHWLGRPVAAIFIFLCAEGFYYTRDKKGYLLRLLIFFWGMSLGNSLLSRLMPMEDVVLINNIFGTLFLAAFYMWMVDLIRKGMGEKKPGKILLAAGGILLPFIIGAALLLALNSRSHTLVLILMYIPNAVSAEGGPILIFLGLFFYMARNYRYVQAALVAAASLLSWFIGGGARWIMEGDIQGLLDGGAPWLIIGAVIPILLYNGRRGRGFKYFFYVFYPAHIYLLYTIAWFMRAY